MQIFTVILTCIENENTRTVKCRVIKCAGYISILSARLIARVTPISIPYLFQHCVSKAEPAFL